MKIFIINAVLVIAFILVTFFGLGPVIFADGSMSERGLTLIAVLIVYAVLIVLARYLRKRR